MNLVLDEKKCLTMKSTIEHIQSRLRDALGVPQYDDKVGADKFGGNQSEKDESGDDLQIMMPL